MRFSILIVVTLLALFEYSKAQEFKVFAGDTINYIDTNGIKQGLWYSFLKSGQIYDQKYYVNDKLHGEYKRYFTSGILKEEETFVNGIKHGPFKYNYGNGTIKEEGIYANNEINGWHISYYSSEFGRKEREGKFLLGVEEGMWTHYDKQGNMSSKGEYINGKPNGLWLEFDQDGTIVKKSTYDAGIIIITVETN